MKKTIFEIIDMDEFQKKNKNLLKNLDDFDILSYRVSFYFDEDSCISSLNLYDYNGINFEVDLRLKEDIHFKKIYGVDGFKQIEKYVKDLTVAQNLVKELIMEARKKL